MQKQNASQTPASRMDQRNIIIATLIVLVIISAAAFLIGLDLLVGIAWAFIAVSAMALTGTALWMIRHPESYPQNASLPQRAKVQLAGSLFLSVCVVVLDRAAVFSMPPAFFILLQAVLLAMTTIQMLALSGASHHINEVDNKVQSQCRALRTMQLDLERLAGDTQDANLADGIRQLAEAVRFSDPLGNAALTDIEEELQKAVDELEQNILKQNTVQAQHLLKRAVFLLEERNKKCLISK